MKTYIKNGYFHKTKEPFKGELDLEKFVKTTLAFFGIPSIDPCCEAGNQALVNTPVLFNTLTGRLEKYNPVSGEFIASSVTSSANLAAIDTSATVSAVSLTRGVITSLSAAPVTATLPTAALLGTELSALRGTILDFAVDNSVGASTVTVALGTDITVLTAVITGADTLTVAAGTVGLFKLYFTSATTAKLTRIA